MHYSASYDLTGRERKASFARAAEGAFAPANSQVKGPASSITSEERSVALFRSTEGASAAVRGPLS